MHDPMSVAHEIRYPWPWPKRAFSGTRELLITIWHIDPELRGDDDSCDWFNHKRPRNAAESALAEAQWDLETLLDNEPHYPSSREHLAFQRLKAATHAFLHRPSRTHWWQLHPRWHVWHWRIQIHPVQDFKRWAFSRCAGCGRRFAFGYSPVSHSWNGTGPRWFRGERGVFHSECAHSGEAAAKSTA